MIIQIGAETDTMIMDVTMISEAFESEGFKKLLSEAIDRRSKCGACPIYNFCSGGCNNVALYENGISNNMGTSCRIAISIYQYIFKDVISLKSNPTLYDVNTPQIQRLLTRQRKYSDNHHDIHMYSGAGLENYEGKDLQGAIVDLMTVVGELREAYSQLCDLFIGVKNKNDTNEYEDMLEDEELRKDFYNLLCKFGKALAIVVNSEKAYEAVPREEISKFKAEFIMFSKIRKSVKLRYADAIDNKEYEPIMQNLLDQNLSVTGLKIITAPVDILDSDGLEKQLKELGSARSKADAIRSRITKSISEKYDENPAYYDSFSKKIKETLELYKKQVISEAEYLDKMTKIMEEYRSGSIPL